MMANRPIHQEGSSVRPAITFICDNGEIDWLVDARGDAPSLDILQPTRRGFRAARKRDGWVKSYIFLQYFKLTRQTDRRDQSPFRLEVRKGAR
jgi:hypothetical protein